jgi:acyl-[acyl-carrier-protein]-phospholipid O-acyltransferase / long-chain-fatty-acid--[acyl-carrier-protein] ligase
MPKLPAGLSALNTTQFLGAMNDNILKLLIIFFLIHHQGAGKAGIITACAGVAFVLPFLLFSAPAGCLSDRFSKTRVSVAVKLLEVVVTALAVATFAMKLEWGLYVVLFLMATHSAFFAPAKYGIIPELAPRDELSRANGLIESFTFLAIIFGTTLASALAQAVGGRFWLAACFCLIIAVIGLISSLRLPKVPAVAPDRRIRLFPSEIFRTLHHIRHDHWLMLAIIGLAWFMLVGAFTQLNLIGYGIQQLGLDEAKSGYLFLASAFGIAGGSLLAARLSGKDVELGIVPMGAIGLAIAPVLLHNAPANLPTVLAIILLLGVSAGLFSLPLQTFIQMRTEAEIRGEVLAASSFINWIGILIASALTFLFSGPLQMTAAQGFSVMGVLTLVLTLLTILYLPDFLLRFVALIVMNLLYRIRVDGKDYVPPDSSALLVANHVSWIDALQLIATRSRRIRFVMARSIYDTPAGPNLMTGYLGRPDETALLICNGRYTIGDIGFINDEGFVVITDRLTRFSRIGDEMIPHGAVEVRLMAALASTDLLLAVTAVPDENNGERIAVVYDQTQLDEAQVRQAIEQADLPNLWKPSLLVAAGSVPFLNSGKLDLKGLKMLAEMA